MAADNVDSAQYQRLYVGQLNENISSNDLIGLFSKVAKVEEVYYPNNAGIGNTLQNYRWKSGFAIVKIRGDGGDALKCIQTLRGILWKGCKLKIERAKEYFQDRMQKEKTSDTVRTSENDSSLPNPSILQTSMKSWQEPILNIRRAKFAVKKKVLAEPIIAFENKRYILQSAKNVKESQKNIVPSGTKLLFDEALFEQYNSKGLDEVQEAIKKKGPGVRKGFGTLLKEPEPAEKISTVTKTNQKLEVPDNNLKGVVAPQQSVAKTTMDWLIQNPTDEDDNDYHKTIEDHQPVDEAEEFKEITSEELEEERKRIAMLATLSLQSFQQNPVPENKDEANNKKVSKEEARRQKKEKQLAEMKEKEMIAQSEKKLSDNDTKEVKEVANQTIELAKVEVSEQGVFADLNTLKSIFHKSEGVWWDTDQTIKADDQVAKGELSKDLIFIEAEKVGFDIRGNTTTIGSNLDNNNQKSSTAGAIFNFFGDDTGNSNAVESMDVDKPVTEAFVKNELLPLIKLAEIFSLARSFSRTRPLEQTQKEWKTERVKLLQDCKRKRREARKRRENPKRRKMA